MFVTPNETIHYDTNCRKLSHILSTKCTYIVINTNYKGIDFEIDRDPPLLYRLFYKN